MKNYLFILLSTLFLFSCGSDDPEPEIDNILIIPGIGITDVSLGDTGQDLFDAYGTTQDSYVSFGDDYNHFLLYLSTGLNFYLEPYPSEELDLTKPVIRINISSPSTAKTAEGIGIGSTMAEVKAAYGDPISSSIFGDAYDGMTIDYDTTDIVDSIEIE